MRKNTISFLALAVYLNFSGLIFPAYGIGEEGDETSSKSTPSGSSSSSSSASAQSPSQVQKFKSFFPRIKEDEARAINAEFQEFLKDYDTWSEDEKNKYTPDLKDLFKMTPSKTVLDYLRRLKANIKESLDNTGKSTNRFPDLDSGQIARLTKRVDSLSFLDTPDAQTTLKYGKVIVSLILADLTDPLSPNISEANNLLESFGIHNYNDALLVSGQEDFFKIYGNQKTPKNLGDDGDGVDYKSDLFFISEEFSQFIRNHVARISPLEVPDLRESASYETIIQNFLNNRYMMGVSQTSVHGTQLYPFATFAHDRFDHRTSGFREEVFLKYIHSNVGILWKKNPITALNTFTKDILPWLTDIRPALFDFFRGLHGAMSAEHQPDSLEYKTYIAGHFLLARKLKRWGEGIYQQYDTASLVKFLTNRGLTRTNPRRVINPFKTSPVTGKTAMTRAEIEKYIIENQGDFEKIRGWHEDPSLPKEVIKVKELPLVTVVTLRYKANWEQREVSVPTLHGYMKSSEDLAYKWKYLGMSPIVSPDFSVITDATQQRHVAYDYLKKHTKRNKDLFKAWGKIVGDVLTTEKGRQIAESFDKFAAEYKLKLEKAGLFEVYKSSEELAKGVADLNANIAQQKELAALQGQGSAASSSSSSSSSSGSAAADAGASGSSGFADALSIISEGDEAANFEG